ncbi:MAG TPA: hypothetical protein VGP91_16160 [Actinoplanes sp.]|nr:hypothetical protein [Actinoplanes sp.]
MRDAVNDVLTSTTPGKICLDQQRVMLIDSIGIGILVACFHTAAASGMLVRRIRSALGRGAGMRSWSVHHPPRTRSASTVRRQEEGSRVSADHHPPVGRWHHRNRAERRDRPRQRPHDAGCRQ